MRENNISLPGRESSFSKEATNPKKPFRGRNIRPENLPTKAEDPGGTFPPRGKDLRRGVYMCETSRLKFPTDENWFFTAGSIAFVSDVLVSSYLCFRTSRRKHASKVATDVVSKFLWRSDCEPSTRSVNFLRDGEFLEGRLDLFDASDSRWVACLWQRRFLPSRAKLQLNRVCFESRKWIYKVEVNVRFCELFFLTGVMYRVCGYRLLLSYENEMWRMYM